MQVTVSQPVASFSANPKKGCNPLKVDFTNTSAGATGYLWKFGNGNTSVITNPSAIYNNPGNYSITLIAYDAAGKKDTAYYLKYITVFKSPTANFSTSAAEICAGDSIKITDKTVLGSAPIKSYSWDMGDGGTSSQKEPTYPYILDGTFDITMAIEDTNGCTGFAKLTKVIKVNKLPTAVITNSPVKKCTVPVKVNFTCSSSGLAPLTYLWSFGNGKTDTAKAPIYTFDTAGNYTIGLTVKNSKGCSIKTSKPSLIILIPPVADFAANQTRICPHQGVQFVNNSGPIDGTGNFKWSFSNGFTTTADNPYVIFHNPGKYKATLTYNWDGCSSTKIKDTFITVLDTPSGFITPKDTVVCRRPGYFYTYNVKGKNIDIISWNGPQTGVVNLKYLKPYNYPLGTNGRHTIRAIAVAANGCQTPLDTVAIIIRGPLASILADTVKGCLPYWVNAKWNGSSNTKIISYQWESKGITGVDSFINFKNTVFGDRIIRLTVSDINGCIDSTQKIIIAGVHVDLELTIPNKICKNEKFYLHRKSNINGLDSIKFFYYRDQLDSLPFPPPDSIKQKLIDTPGTYVKYGLIANSNGCITKLAENKRPKLRVMGPQIEAIVKSDCEKDSINGINKSKEYTKSWWRYTNGLNNTEINNGKKIDRKLNETHKLWLFAENDTNKCYDSMPFNTTVDLQTAYFSYTYNCDSQTIQTSNNYLGLNDTQFYWELTYLPTGKKAKYSGRNINVKLLNTGNYNLLLSPNNPIYTCTKSYTKKITVYKNPGVKPTVTLNSIVCYPINIQLKDPSYKLWYKANWSIGKLLTVKDSQQNIALNYIDNESALQIYLNKQDSNFCNYIDTFAYNIGGVKATIDYSQFTDPCFYSKINVQAKLVNGTTGATYTYVWDWGSKTSTGAADSIIESGIKTVNVALWVKDNKGCESKDKKSFQIKTGRPKAKFSVSDSTAVCPPFNLFLNDLSSPGNSPITNWFWDFGDSSYSGKKDPGKIYVYPGKFSIKLIVSNTDGCKDTSLRKDLIVVNGPIGSYTVDKKLGCTPLNIKLKTWIKGKIVTMEYDMGDGAVLNAKDSLYTYTRAGNYTPRLILIDSFGCKYSPPPSDTIIVHPLPIADFDNFKVCNNQLYVIPNRSFYDVDQKGLIRWQLNGIVKSTKDTALLLFLPGRNHEVQLYVTTNFGCADSVKKPFIAYNINPAIKPAKKMFCLGEKIKITNISTADTSILWSKIWVDGKPLDPITMTIPGSSRGVVPGFMIVRDALGCSDTFRDSVFIKIGDTIPPPPLFIYRSSVLDNFNTETKFNQSVEPDFYQYNLLLWLNGKWTRTNTSFQVKDTNLIATALNTLGQSYCHVVSQTNFCYRNSDSIIVLPHCTVNVSAKGDTNVSLVSWNAYSGWQNVMKYKIWRKKKTDTLFQLHDSVAGNILNYNDSNIYCHVEYDYKIESIEMNGFKENSFSDTARAKPIHHIPVPAPEVWRTTVDTNLYTYTEWVELTKLKYPIEYYTVWKNTNSIWAIFKDTILPGKNKIDDYLVDVNKYNYDYSVAATDVCQTKSLKGKIGRNILLSIAPVSTEINPRLNWTPYVFWNEGVKEYIIERSLEKSVFIPIGTVGGNVTTYLDETLPRACAKDFTYRIKGIRNQPVNFPDSTTNCFSVSNYSEFVPEIRFFIPNAFTPDLNNLNEKFHPDGMYFYKYKMDIYNRYGQKVYTGDTCLNEWDGNYDKKPAPSGVYAYNITAWDLQGKSFRFAGSLHLIR